jgi:hypothetical protein
MFFSLLTLIVALAISGVAAWYSIVGLMAIFASAAIPIAIMGSVLEVGKLLTASWLYRNWYTAPKFLKGYLTASVIVLMFITSMGIFGFLSKAHIDQTITGSDNKVEISIIEKRILREEKVISDAEKVIAQLDSAVETLTKYDRIRGKDGAIAVRQSQKVERDELRRIIDTASENISKFRSEKLVLQKEQIAFEAEVGPIKYIAELFTDDSADVIDDAVRWVIITIIFVFDPLAVLLVIAANIGLKSQPLPEIRKPKRAVVVDTIEEEWNEEAEIEEEASLNRTEMSLKEMREQQNARAFKDNGTFR